MASIDDEQLIKNYSLFISVRQSRPVEEKLENIRCCLEHGADVNAADGNDGYNSPLHVAARRGEVPIARLLLRHGADVTRKNCTGNTPLTIVRALSTEDKEEMLNLLQAAESEKSVKHDHLPTTSGRPQSSRVFESFNSEANFKYKKSAGLAASAMRGQLYETKLLTLVLMRAEDDEEIEQFYLASNVSGIGDMSDICLRYQVRGQEKPVALFVQVKYRGNREKVRIIVDDKRSAFGDFSLLKYFQSYLMIKDRFQANNEDPMFDGDFNAIECNFILYTPAREYFTNKKTFHKRNVSEKVHYLISTAQDNFQYDYDDNDIHILTKIPVIHQLKKLGVVFLEFIMSEKVSHGIFYDKVIGRYHVALGREVLRQCSTQQANNEYRLWEFRPEFFESDSEYLDDLKKTFDKELSTKRCDQSTITNEDRENFQLLLQDPCALTISKLIGKLVKYNDNINKLRLIENTAFKKKFKSDEFKILLERLDEIEISKNVISEAVRIKLVSMTFKLPLAFGNSDMTFRGNEAKIEKRMKAVADRLMNLFEMNKETKIVEINDNVVGPGKLIERSFIDINGGIGGAVGNLLVLDMDTNMLKLDLENEALPTNAALFLNELKNEKYKPINEQLRGYRLNIDTSDFPKYSLNEHDPILRKQARDFLNKLWFYTDQAKDDEVELHVRDHITKKLFQMQHVDEYQLQLLSDAIFLRTHDEIQKWWMQPAARYLNRECKLIERAKHEIDVLTYGCRGNP